MIVLLRYKYKYFMMKYKWILKWIVVINIDKSKKLFIDILQKNTLLSSKNNRKFVKIFFVIRII